MSESKAFPLQEKEEPSFESRKSHKSNLNSNKLDEFIAEHSVDELLEETPNEIMSHTQTPIGTQRRVSSI